MMRKLLLDTHTMLWAMYNSKVLPEDIKMLIDIRYNDIYLSIASLWEIEIKHIKHPQEMPYSAKEIYNDAKTSYKFLSIDQNHVQELSSLDDIHSDPFDKILMAQAKAESLEFVTADEKIAQYGYSFIVPFRHL